MRVSSQKSYRFILASVALFLPLLLLALSGGADFLHNHAASGHERPDCPTLQIYHLLSAMVLTGTVITLVLYAVRFYGLPAVSSLIFSEFSPRLLRGPPFRLSL